jgi:hypothetical protein
MSAKGCPPSSRWTLARPGHRAPRSWASSRAARPRGGNASRVARTFQTGPKSRAACRCSAAHARQVRGVVALHRRHQGHVDGQHRCVRAAVSWRLRLPGGGRSLGGVVGCGSVHEVCRGRRSGRAGSAETTYAARGESSVANLDVGSAGTAAQARRVPCLRRRVNGPPEVLSSSLEEQAARNAHWVGIVEHSPSAGSAAPRLGRAQRVHARRRVPIARVSRGPGRREPPPAPLSLRVAGVATQSRFRPSAGRLQSPTCTSVVAEHAPGGDVLRAQDSATSHGSSQRATATPNIARQGQHEDRDSERIARLGKLMRFPVIPVLKRKAAPHLRLGEQRGPASRSRRRGPVAPGAAYDGRPARSPRAGSQFVRGRRLPNPLHRPPEAMAALGADDLLCDAWGVSFGRLPVRPCAV